MNDISFIGLDIAKQTFHLVGLNALGRQVLKKTFRRSQLIPYFANLPGCIVAMEGCASAHHWARQFMQLGHQVKLLPAQYVRAYVRGNKNDYNDALAIAEASRVPEMRTVTIKTVEQQSVQALHRMRKSVVAERTALANQLRGLLGEFGFVFNQGLSAFRKALPYILEDAENNLHPRFRHALSLKYEHLCQLDALVDALTEQLAQEARRHPEIRRLQTIPGFGAIVASAFYSVFGDGKAFNTGRDVSAALGLVLRQYSSGGKNTLLGISKRGDKYLRSLVVHGARSVVTHAHKKDDPLNVWVTRLVERRGINKATVALANKLTRIAWAMLARGEDFKYQPVV